MRKAILGSVLLAMSIACTGCDSGGNDGGGGSGGGGSNAPLSFDTDTALPASGASALAISLGAELGVMVSTVLDAVVEAPSATTRDLSRKATLQLPGLCPGGGGATLDFNSFQVGQDLTLTFAGCVGTVFSGSAVDGTMVLTIEAIASGFPSEARAAVNLTAPNTTVTGSFKVIASRAGLAAIDMCLGDQLDTDLLTITTGNETIEIACFKIRQVISFTGAATIGVFEPVGVVRRNGTQVFTMNSYAQQPPNIGFNLSNAPISGSFDTSGGDGTTEINLPSPPPFCAAFGSTPPGDNSFVSNQFAGESCVMVDGEDANGTPFSLETTWSKLLAGDFTPGEALCAAPTTEATPSPVQCFMGNDIVAAADAYVRGDGPEGNNSDTNYGTAVNLLIKSVGNMFFTRKTYIVFDLSSFSDSFTKASLILTLDRHVEAQDPQVSGPQPTDVYGIIDDMDWDPAMLAEDAITWNNAPRNDKNNPSKFETSPGVPLLIGGYDFRLGGEGVIDVPGTKYALDITDYVTERLANDADGKISILMVISTSANLEGSSFRSLNIPDADMCDRPFLHFE